MLTVFEIIEAIYAPQPKLEITGMRHPDGRPTLRAALTARLTKQLIHHYKDLL